jgi:ABC-2 type transport system permease protein
MFFVSLRHLVFWRLIDVVLGIGLLVYGLFQKHFIPSLTDVGFFFISIFAALLIIYSLWMLLMTTAFWVIRMDDLSFLFNSFFETTRFPITMYKGWLRMALTYVLPAAFVTFTPASSLIGKWDGRATIAAVFVAIVFFMLARRFWKFALANYTSASS